MRQATFGGVGICHAMQEKRNLLSYADFLLVTAVRTGQLTGPRYSPLASHTNFWKALTDLRCTVGIGVSHLWFRSETRSRGDSLPLHPELTACAIFPFPQQNSGATLQFGDCFVIHYNQQEIVPESATKDNRSCARTSCSAVLGVCP